MIDPSSTSLFWTFFQQINIVGLVWRGVRSDRWLSDTCWKNSCASNYDQKIFHNWPQKSAMKIPFQWCITHMGSIWKLSAQKINFPPKTMKIVPNLIKWNDKALIKRRIFRPWPLFIYMFPIYLCSPGSQLSIGTSHIGLTYCKLMSKSDFLNWIPSSSNLRKVTYFLFWTFYDTFYIKQTI